MWVILMKLHWRMSIQSSIAKIWCLKRVPLVAKTVRVTLLQLIQAKDQVEWTVHQILVRHKYWWRIKLDLSQEMRLPFWIIINRLVIHPLRQILPIRRRCQNPICFRLTESIHLLHRIFKTVHRPRCHGIAKLPSTAWLKMKAKIVLR